MALPGFTLMRLRALCNLGSKTFEIGNRVGINCTWASRHSTKVGPVGTLEGTAETTKGHPSLLNEFPEPKDLLYRTLARSLGLSDPSHLIQYNCTDGEVKRATVTVMWPQKIETVGFGSRKILAERHAAAAACQKLKELGVLEADNLPRRKKGRGRASPASVWQDEDEECEVPLYKSTFLSRPQSRTKRLIPVSKIPEDDPRVQEARSIFSQPKALLWRVIQMAVSPNKVRETVQYRTVGRKFKTCELTLHWPEKVTFEAFGRNKLEAEKKASALACLRLKELELLDENNEPLTHAQYHKEEVREAGKRMRQPCSLVIPEELEDKMRRYLTQYPIEAEMQKLWAEEDQQAASHQAYEEDDEAEEEAVIDTITGQPYRPLAPAQEQRLSDRLLNQWESANPGLGVSLPVDAHRERVVSVVEGARVVVLAGETGCGKTTRVPRFLLEGRIRAGEGAGCNILVTQPRRISAVSVAQRVAQEMGPALKPSVGYQVRLESRPPERSGGALLFLTVGVLLRKLQSNPTLRGVSHVVVDEVHERDVNTDLLLALLRAVLPQNPHLRLVLMSATGDTQRLVQYFGGCPVVHVPGFMHPVRERYLEEVLREMGRQPQQQQAVQQSRARRGDDDDDATPDLNLVANVINHIHKTGDPGAVLCFLPGWQDIKAVQQKLEESPSFRSGSQMILPLHSSMSVADQQAVFQRPPEGQRKIVLATNIAETSITIDDIVHVVDVGSQKEQSYDPKTKVSCLDTVWVSRSNVTQRKGRAGRCQPGHSYHLFPRERLDSMTTFPIPEILRTPLESLVLQAKIHSPQSKAVEFLSQVLDSPDRTAIKEAVRILQEIGVLDKLESLTPLGERVACMSCDPRLGKVLVLSALFRCTSPLISVAACLTRDPFYNSMENRALIHEAKEELGGSSCSDFLVFSRAVQGWREEQDRDCRNEYLNKYTLSGASLRFIQGLARQFSVNLCEAELVSNPNDCLRPSSTYNQFSQEDELLKAVLMAGLYPNLIQVKRGVVNKGRFRPDGISFRTQTGPVIMHRSTINRGKTQLPSRWMTFFSAVQSNGQVFIRDSSSVHPLALLLMTDCDLTERVSGDHVEVALPGRSLVRWELSTETWNLLWELRTSLQAMFHRNLRPHAGTDSPQDTELISLLVDLLNHTDQQGEDGHSDAE
ncbi:ATP-dependent RNA helicase DHX30 [Alosa sapidissima]|uniref:ATP-dependent RNA helicase DHX30 n=1 Tax=Alosa sapidissima TaxID=34773 RepID=UPI001C0A5F79|nr:ATP-dependent RNA helicase DHX30 [Alosa sapidissima]